MNDADQIAKQLVDDVRKRCDDLLTLTDEWSDLEDRIATALRTEREKVAEIERLRKALQKIAFWHDQFPPTGRFYTGSDGLQHEMTFETVHGSNGARDYMRGVATAALKGGDA